MKSHTKSYFLAILAICSFYVTLAGEEIKIEDVLEKESFSVFVKALDNVNAKTFPMVKYGEDQADNDKIDVINSFYILMCSKMIEYVEDEKSTLEMKIQTLTNLNIFLKSLRRYEGYVVVDLSNRLMLCHIVKDLKTSNIKAVKDRLSFFNETSLKLDDLILAFEGFQAIPRIERFSDILSYYKIDFKKVLESVNLQKTGTLLTAKNKVYLLYRVAMTDWFKRVNIDAYIKFIELGGDVKLISENDVQYFKKFMTPSLREIYSYPLLGRSRLYASDLVILRDFLSEDKMSSFSFYAIATSLEKLN